MIRRPPRSTLFPYTRSSDLEQVNRLIIQDMQDGVLVVDLTGVVRGHNAQVTRLLGDRKSTRLNSSHVEISYAVFCLKKKKKGGNTGADQHVELHFQVCSRSL